MSEKQQVRLTPVVRDDLKQLFEWINDKELVAFNARYKRVSWEDHLSWYESLLDRKDIALFAIRTVPEDRLIGSCQLRGVDSGHKTAELVIRIGARDCWGRGLGTQTVRLLVAHAFDDLGLERVELHVFADNLRAVRVYEKVGFVTEGVLRKAVEIEGIRKDLMVMGLLRHEFQSDSDQGEQA